MKPRGYRSPLEVRVLFEQVLLGVGYGSSMLRKLLRLGIALSACLVALRVGYYLLGLGFKIYDDEGYILLALKHYMGGGQLYTHVYAEYGPVFFFVESGLFRLFHLPVTHDAGRHITLLLWFLSSAAAAWFVFRVSRSVLTASAAGLVTMLVSRGLAAEPNHPEHLVLLVLTLTCCASTFESPGGLFVLGALCAAMVFIKINIGVFLLAAAFGAWCCVLRPGLFRKVGALGFLVFFIAGPVVLMRQDVRTWAGGFCGLALLCGGWSFATALYVSPRFANVRSMAAAAAGAVVVSAVVLMVTMLQGIPLRTLIEAILLNPLHHPQGFEVPLRIPWIPILGVAVVVAGVFGLHSFLRTKGRSTAWIELVRGAVGLFMVGVFVLDYPHLSAMTLWLPISLLPGHRREWSAAEYVPRLFVTLLAAAMLLESYPVAGSQVIISCVPLALWCFLCIQDGVSELLRRFPQWSLARGQLPAAATLAGALLVLCLEAKALKGGLWRMRFFTPASTLRGSGYLHLEPEAEETFTTLANSVSSNCDMLFTLPGMGSLNLWSGEPTPNGMNFTAWVRFFRPEQQQEILRILRSDPNACVVTNLRLGSYWNPPEYNATSPLASYILNDMPVVLSDGDYQIAVNPQRQRPWVQPRP